MQATRTYTPAIVPSTRGDHKSCCLSPVDSPVDASVLVVMFERYQEKARPPRKYSTANFPLYERTTAPPWPYESQQGAFNEKSRHRPWIFFTSTTPKPNSAISLYHLSSMNFCGFLSREDEFLFPLSSPLSSLLYPRS